MDTYVTHTHARLCAIHSWENEGGALAQEVITVSAMNRFTVFATDDAGIALGIHRPS